MEDALLGFATTKQLIDEVVARLRVKPDSYHEQLAHHLQEILGMLPNDVLSYRSVDKYK